MSLLNEHLHRGLIDARLNGHSLRGLVALNEADGFKQELMKKLTPGDLLAEFTRRNSWRRVGVPLRNTPRIPRLTLIASACYAWVTSCSTFIDNSAFISKTTCESAHDLHNAVELAALGTISGTILETKENATLRELSYLTG